MHISLSSKIERIKIGSNSASSFAHVSPICITLYTKIYCDVLGVKMVKNFNERTVFTGAVVPYIKTARLGIHNMCHVCSAFKLQSNLFTRRVLKVTSSTNTSIENKNVTVLSKILICIWILSAFWNVDSAFPALEI